MLIGSFTSAPHRNVLVCFYVRHDSFIMCPMPLNGSQPVTLTDPRHFSLKTAANHLTGLLTVFKGVSFFHLKIRQFSRGESAKYDQTISAVQYCAKVLYDSPAVCLVSLSRCRTNVEPIGCLPILKKFLLSSYLPQTV